MTDRITRFPVSACPPLGPRVTIGFITPLPARCEEIPPLAAFDLPLNELLAPNDRLNPERLIDSLKSGGKPAFYLATADAIVAELGNHVRSGEVVCVFSNGGFGGIHDKLLSRFALKAANNR